MFEYQQRKSNKTNKKWDRKLGLKLFWCKQIYFLKGDKYG